MKKGARWNSIFMKCIWEGVSLPYVKSNSRESTISIMKRIICLYIFI